MRTLVCLVALAAVATAAAPGSITIRRGDTLWSLAKKHQTSVAELQELNGLSDDRIEAGDTLLVPAAQQRGNGRGKGKVKPSRPAPPDQTPPPTGPTSPPDEPRPPVSSDPPPAGGYLRLEPVGSWRSLPGDAEAAALVRRSTWEPRPENAAANATAPSGLALGPHGGVEPIWNEWLLPRVTGDFSGTTDEIFQWAAAKWGLPDDLLRAQAVAESYWYQGLLDGDGRPVNGRGFGDFSSRQADCPPGYSAPCPLSFGVLQVKAAPFHPGVFPHARDSTAFNVDYVAALLRGCYEGWETWLTHYGTDARSYAAGDLEGCIGRWYSGRWYGSAAESYIGTVKDNITARPWLRPGF